MRHQSITFSVCGFSLILSMLSLTVNSYLIPSSCRYLNSELCKKYFDKINYVKYFDVDDPHYPKNVNDEFMRRSDEDIQNLRYLFKGLAHTECINLGDDSCNNGSLPGSGKDDDFLNGAGNPGKRSSGIDNNCLGVGDDGCQNYPFPRSGKDYNFGNSAQPSAQRFF